MAKIFGSWGPSHPWLGSLSYAWMWPWMAWLARSCALYSADSRFARNTAASMRRRLEEGQTVYLLGLGAGSHNAGAALVSVSAAEGVNVLCNEEEERYRGVKHFSGYPEYSVAAVLRRLEQLGLTAADIHACLAAWDYRTFILNGWRTVGESFPRSLSLLLPSAVPKFSSYDALSAFDAPRRLGQQLGLGRPVPTIALRHHDNHAWFSYAASPFAKSAAPTLVTCIDGYGDDSAISLYIGEHGHLRLLQRNRSLFDSLGIVYTTISTTQGGWTELSSEGRFMGAAAWGNDSRLTNPYYRELRQLFYFAPEGEVHVNREMAGWHLYGARRPYRRALQRVLGAPIPRKQLWNPDAVLRVESEHEEPTRERLDKAAALQLVFEDALFHIVGHLLRSSGSDQLVLTGGTALNCIANMKLLEHFDEAFYQRYLGRRTRLQVWVPPTPGDAGVPMGAPYHFALANGASPGMPLRHAFYCGVAAGRGEIEQALHLQPCVAYRLVADTASEAGRERLADLIAWLLKHDAVVGLYQGAAETGPRALGHRSILANPCNPNTLDEINKRVKHRERLRPLAPMVTRQAAEELFQLEPGAGADHYNAYGYMVLTARAKPAAHARIPAAVHRDGTGRIQIVREDQDPLTHAILRAAGRYLGVEALINTSLNVASPIAQTPTQALQVLTRSRGLSALFMVAREGDAYMVWDRSEQPPKDAGCQLNTLHERWQQSFASGRPVPQPDLSDATA